ncbi:hypothetical protein CcaverHIS641_0201220 [Cutaneotrichosporon cavernicola]|nr:hypothetical protein CcaverHIS641_0201220 [Cutaneotrichosporon cavernicola]
MTADTAPVVARLRRRQHFHHPPEERAHHPETLPFLGRAVRYIPHVARQESSANTSPPPSSSTNDASPPAKNDTPAPNVDTQSPSVPSSGVTDTPPPNVTHITPSPSEAAKVDGVSTDDTHQQTVRQTPQGTDGAVPSPPQSPSNSGAPSGNPAPAPSSIPTTIPDVQPPESTPTPDPAPSTDPAPQGTSSSSESAPPAETTNKQIAAAKSQEVWQAPPETSITQELAAGPTQETFGQPSQTTAAASAESTTAADTPTSSEVVAGIIGAVSSSSSALASSSAAAVAGIASSRSVAPGGTSLTPKVHPTSPGVTASPSRAASPSTNASNSATAASAGSENESLSAGAKAGIAIGVIAAIGVALLVIMFCVRRSKRSKIISTPAESNPYAFSTYGAALEKGGASDLRRNGTQHSALDFSDGPLPNQRSRWRHLSTFAVPFANQGRSRGSVGPGLAGVGSSPTRLDLTKPSMNQAQGAYPYARSDSDDDHSQVMQLDDDASHFRNTHYEEWLAYDNAGVFNSPTDSPAANPSPSRIRQPQARRVPVPPLDPDPFADPQVQTPTRPSPARSRTLENMYGICAEEAPVVQHTQYRVTPPPVQAQIAQHQYATVEVGHAV